MAGIKWSLSPARLFEWLGDVRRRQIETGVKRVAERNAAKIEEWMRSNAVWQDISGDARRELKAEVLEVTGRAAFILLRHGTDYGGLYLETMQAGRFSIIGPALDHFAPLLMRDLQIELAGGSFVRDWD